MIDILPLDELGYILDLLDIKSLYEVSKTSKLIFDKINHMIYNDKYSKKIKKYNEFITSIGNIKPYLLNLKYGGNDELLIIIKEMDILSPPHAFASAYENDNFKSINLLNKWGYTDDGALAFCAVHGFNNGIKRACELKTYSNDCIRVVFECACQKGNIEIMKILKLYLDKDHTFSLYAGNIEAIELLHEWGARDYNNAFYWASSGGKIDIIDYLILTYGDKINVNYGIVPASKNGHVDVLKKLINLGATNLYNAYCIAQMHKVIKSIEFLERFINVNYYKFKNI